MNQNIASKTPEIKQNLKILAFINALESIHGVSALTEDKCRDVRYTYLDLPEYVQKLLSDLLFLKKKYRSKIHITQRTLGRWCGVSREHVNRTLHLLEAIVTRTKTRKRIKYRWHEFNPCFYHFTTLFDNDIVRSILSLFIHSLRRPKKRTTYVKKPASQYVDSVNSITQDLIVIKEIRLKEKYSNEYKRSLQNNEATRARQKQDELFAVEVPNESDNKQQIPFKKRGYEEPEIRNMNSLRNKDNQKNLKGVISESVSSTEQQNERNYLQELAYQADKKDAARLKLHGNKIEKKKIVPEDIFKKQSKIRNEVLFPIYRLVGKHVREAGCITLSQFPMPVIEYAIHFSSYTDFKGGYHDSFNLLVSECRNICRINKIKPDTNQMSEYRDLFDVKSFEQPTEEKPPTVQKTSEVGHYYDPTERLQEYGERVAKQKQQEEVKCLAIRIEKERQKREGYDPNNLPPGVNNLTAFLANAFKDNDKY